MNTDNKEPVLIVGAGPTGMVLANELLRRRVPCRMIDKRRGPSETSRSFTLHAKTMEMFEHMGLAHTFLSDGIISKGFYFNFKGQDAHPALDFTGLDSQYPYILVYNQNDTEQRLREHLDAVYNFQPEWNVELTDFTEIDNGYDAKLESVNGHRQSIKPRWIIGCDGVNSFVRQKAGLDFDGETYEGMVMQMMDVEYSGFEGSDDWVHYYMSKQSFLLLTKLPNGNHRVLISDMGEADDPDLTPRQAFQRLIDGHVDGTTLAEPEWATKWEIWKRIANDYRAGNCFLAGDAAHVHSPSGGQGMNAGMQDAFNLGWKVAMVALGQAKATLLDTYGPERQPIGAQVIEGTDAMHDIIMAHGRGMDDRLQLTQREGWHGETVNRISGLSYTYRDVTDVPEGLRPLAGPACGDRAPDVIFESNRRLFEFARTTRLSLFIVAGSSANEADAVELHRQICADFPAIIRSGVVLSTSSDALGSVEQLNDPSGGFEEQYGAVEGGQLLLMRPDGYIAFRSRLADHARLTEYLNAQYIGAST